MSKLNILSTHHAFADYQYWQQQDKKMLKRINQLIKSIQRDGAVRRDWKTGKTKGKFIWLL